MKITEKKSISPFYDKVRRIAVLAPNKKFLGAQIVTIPFYRALKSRFPAALINVYSPCPEASFLTELGLAEQVYIYDLKAGIKDFFRLASLIKKEKYDTVFVMRNRSERDDLLAFLSGASIKAGFNGAVIAGVVLDHSYKYNKKRYRALNYLDLLGFSGYEPDAGFSAECGGKIKDEVWFIPCGSLDEKLWPLENYIELARRFSEKKKIKPVFILGPAESGYSDTIKSKLKNAAIYESFSVKELLARAPRCMLSVANDCGPGHIAQISGVPSLVFFRKGANINEWINSGYSCRALESRGAIDEINVDEAEKNAEEMLSA